MSKTAVTTRMLSGKVISNKMDKTIVVLCVRKVKHKVGKYISRSSKIHAHDPDNCAKEGDYVTIAACAPISKKKSWILASVQSEAD